MARPERFELPTTWFEEVTVEFKVIKNSKLDGPLSLISSPNSTEHRRMTLIRYVIVRFAWNVSTTFDCPLFPKADAQIIKY